MWLFAVGKTLEGNKPWKGQAAVLEASAESSAVSGDALVKLCRGAKA
jgi:hypothetical protein